MEDRLWYPALCACFGNQAILLNEDPSALPPLCSKIHICGHREALQNLNIPIFELCRGPHFTMGLLLSLSKKYHIIGKKANLNSQSDFH